MSIAESFGTSRDTLSSHPLPGFAYASTERPLHRLAEVRQNQGVSVRTLARRLGKSMDEVRRQEKPDSDMPLSELYRWQQGLESPVAELLVDIDAPLSGPVLSRARMLRIMKTVRAIMETSKNPGVQRLTTMLESQLIEAMPELRDVSAWHSVGQRRTQDELGRVAERTVPDSFASDSLR